MLGSQMSREDSNFRKTAAGMGYPPGRVVVAPAERGARRVRGARRARAARVARACALEQPLGTRTRHVRPSLPPSVHSPHGKLDY